MGRLLSDSASAGDVLLSAANSVYQKGSLSESPQGQGSMYRGWTRISGPVKPACHASEQDIPVPQLSLGPNCLINTMPP
jgi:hypothetical protein